ncbi:MAG TPA: efflux RND transporter periplasmic adaptor subunit [Polyangiaceae bacterium]
MLIIVAGTVLVLVVGGLLVVRAGRATNHVPLAGSPRPVSVIEAPMTQYRDRRDYVGAVEAWIEADVGPQYVSAYVLDVLVRPGAVVTRGQVLARLDCSNPSALARAAAMQARAAGARRRATADEAARVQTLLDGGFVAQNEAEVKEAQSSSEEATLLESQAKLQSSSLAVQDCVLRAPFDGEIGTRSVDPGAFVRPGTAIVSVVDRDTVRVVVDAPEKDFDVVAPGTVASIQMLATGAQLDAPIARRAPRADPSTRTVHFEIDVPDPQRKYPTATTAIVHVDVGAARKATAIPLYAATEEEGKAKFFVVDHDVARARQAPVVGERGGELYFDPSEVPEHTQIVTQGRALLADGDRVTANPDVVLPPGDAGRGAARGGGGGAGGVGGP